MHAYLEHLLEFVHFIEEWQQEVENAIMYEDAVWMCLGTCVLAHHYCMPDVPFKIDISQCGTNCCEYHFGNLKGHFTYCLNVANANQGCNIADNVNASAFNMKACRNTSGSPYFDGTVL